MTEIETARLHLRPLRSQDLEVLARIYRDPAVRQYRLHPKPASREQCNSEAAKSEMRQQSTWRGFLK
jgi:RimJ/RimL family protein N-acetyltransferase